MADLDLIKQLRDKTQASLADCRIALEESKNDIAKAAEILRLRGKLVAEKKAVRAANAGIIEAYVHPTGRVGVLVELRCETDFVARNELFRQLAHDLALQVAAMNPAYLTPDDVPAAVVEKEREGISGELRSSGKPPEIVEKIISGKLAKFKEERALTMQEFVKDPSRKIQDIITETIGKLGENIRVERFMRFEF